MTEAEWLGVTDRDRLRWFQFLGPRRGRLFGVACCRLLGRWPPTPAADQALAAAELFADTGKTKAALRRGRQAVQAARAALAESRTACELFVVQMVASENATHGVLPTVTERPWCGDTHAEALRRMYPVYAEIAGPLYMPFPTTWRTPTVGALAAGIYSDRAFDRLPVLADALDDAGCDAADVLTHLRGPGPHARGCWALDLVLGKT